ncbi:MAG: fatty acid desaturase family protein [Myxococcota bacterium]
MSYRTWVSGENTPKVSFARQGAGFHAELKRRVDEYFQSRDLSRRATAAMVAKSIFWLGAAVSLYAGVIFSDLGALPSLALSMALGFCIACIGFNVGHDAIHGAYSERPWINRVVGWSFQLIGASAYTWSLSHNVVHHTYTNIPGHDGDLEPGPLLRFHEGQKLRAYHRLQHFYAWPLYCFVGLLWVYTKDFEQALRRDPRTGKRIGLEGWLNVIAAKVLHVGLLVVVPLLTMQRFEWWQLLIGYLGLQFVAGFTLSIVFQLAHVVEGPTMPLPASDGSMADSWAAHQLRTTANFSPGSRAAQFICGGLNYQVEHHLFPKVCHVHYPAIAPIVAQTAREFGLPYYDHPSFLAGVRSHARELMRLGNTGATTPSEEAALAPRLAA